MLGAVLPMAIPRTIGIGAFVEVEVLPEDYSPEQLDVWIYAWNLDETLGVVDELIELLHVVRRSSSSASGGAGRAALRAFSGPALPHEQVFTTRRRQTAFEHMFVYVSTLCPRADAVQPDDIRTGVRMSCLASSATRRSFYEVHCAAMAVWGYPAPPDRRERCRHP